jgi:hypothetical protein
MRKKLGNVGLRKHRAVIMAGWLAFVEPYVTCALGIKIASFLYNFIPGMFWCVHYLANYTRDARKNGCRALSQDSINLWSSPIYLKLLTNYNRSPKSEFSVKSFSDYRIVTCALTDEQNGQSGGVNRHIFANFYWEYVKNVEYNDITYWSTHRNQQTKNHNSRWLNI